MTNQNVWRHKSSSEMFLPANQRPCKALTAAMAVGMDGHFTYTLPYKKNKENALKMSRRSHSATYYSMMNLIFI